ncbi:DUF1854 domain-containing protein [Piscinibacter sakaiensis]|uniref:cyanophycin metabolism-associated DUF1854 family protein n=1 Tax=Piscinibacter sakaiensis TaxID=1547922 RepID=UPI00372BC2BD
MQRNAHGRLELSRDGAPPEEVTPVRAFPLAAPDEGLSLVGGDGHERLWIDRLDALPAAPRALLEAELAEAEFMPRITRIVAVSTFSTPSTWQLQTDRGDTTLVLEGEEDIRRLDGNALLVTDAQGIAFLIPDAKALDRGSRRLLERFL